MRADVTCVPGRAFGRAVAALRRLVYGTAEAMPLSNTVCRWWCSREDRGGTHIPTHAQAHEWGTLNECAPPVAE